MHPVTSPDGGSQTDVQLEGKTPPASILGEKIGLGPFGQEHAPALSAWYNDYSVMKMLDLPIGPRTLSEAERVWDSFFALPDTIAFGVYERATWRLVGATILFHVSHIDKTAEFGIIIGDTNAQGKGYGTEATRLTLDHGFTAMGLRNIILRVFEYNLAGIHIYEKVGFRHMGVRRKSKLMGGRFWDTVYMEALADEFESPVLGEILVPDQPR